MLGLAVLAGFIFEVTTTAPIVKTTNSNITIPEFINTIKEGDEQYSIKELDSVWLLVNKDYSLPSDYKPDDLKEPKVKLEAGASKSDLVLKKEAADALEEMFAVAKQEKLELQLASAYRPYSLQKLFYDNAGGASQVGVAPPGASEHQAGLAVDLRGPDDNCRIANCFKNSSEGKWLAKNAYKFGYVLRYPEGKTDITGYMYEPWHFRYVGKFLAKELNTKDLTLEELFNK